MNHFLSTAFLLTIMFFLSGIDKVKNLEKVAKGLQEKVKIDFPFWIFIIAIVIAAIIELAAPLSIMYTAYTNEYKEYAYISVVALAIFTIIATLVYHFPPTGSTYYPFVSNVTTIGGLTLLALILKNTEDVRNWKLW
jgi:hypothetical protein